MRLYVLVEGQTEQEFVVHVLQPHLGALNVWVYPIVVETSRNAFGRKRAGGGRWSQWLRDLKRLTGQHPGNDVRFTTMFDLYGLPSDFPELDRHAADGDTIRRAERLQAAMTRAVNDHRFIPYLQRHEFEALVLAALDGLAAILEQDADLQALRELVAHMAPEDINDGKTTAPSKRLESLVPSYRKTVHGPLAVEAAGLVVLRRACPRFDAWVTKLEALGVGGTPP